ncbi:hypothetical protein Glo7428_2299 [Gloeocapsa sp. PCC 7428]|uniref:hypothetical protein n=1 Tax=Gloeocapsa sp. PCC 7428 TaxID=1173026 RepID=UPI0002A5BFF7|nr:hypothetical protein [Gloeocapsa sp. PCC 7428]AFZ30812.1 hypothetical protein Glo7428_2299 [Gloeocapsa sp. PCC 7428]
MNASEQTINQKICEQMTQVQAGLEKVITKIFEQAGSKIQLEKREQVEKAIKGTKQILERFKSKYA